MLAEKSGLNPLQISRFSVKRAPPPARARAPTPVKPKEESIPVWPLPKQERLPLVNCECACAPADRRHDVKRKSAAGSDEDSEEDDDTVTLQQVLRTLAASAQKGTRRGTTLLRNMAAVCPAAHVVTLQNIRQLYFYLENDDCVVQEGALCAIAKLITNERNARMFLEHDLLTKILEFLEESNDHYLDECTIEVMEKIICHHGLRQFWEDMMTTKLIPIILQKTSCDNTRAVRLAAARAIRSLVALADLATLVRNQAFSFITQLFNTDGSFKEICCDILADLVKHSEQALLMTVDNGLFHMATDMLKQGPCGCQQRSVLLLAKVGQRDYGRQVIIREKIVPHVMSALTDSKCRKVREASVSVLASLTSTSLTSVYRKVLLQIDRFFEDSDSQISSSVSSSSVSSGNALDRALERLTDSVLKYIREQARIERNEMDGSVEVRLVPCIDTDRERLGSMCSLVTVLINIIITPHHKVKHSVTFSSDNDSVSTTKQEDATDTTSQMRIQTERLQYMFANGGLCAVDLLHAYSSKLIARSCLSNGSTTANLPDIHRLRKVCDAWSRVATPQLAAGAHNVDPTSIFQPLEMELIGKLLELLLVFSLSTTDASLHKLSSTLTDIKSNTDAVCPPSKDCRLIYTAGISEKDIEEDVTWDVTDDECEDVIDDQNHGNVQGDLHFVGGQQRLTRRSHRILLYEAGVIDTAGQLLACTDSFIKTNALNVLHCMLQPLEEPLVRSPTPSTSKTVLTGAVSVTSTEAHKDQALEAALSNMSSKMADLIREALAPGKQIKVESKGQQIISTAGEPVLQKRRPQSAHIPAYCNHISVNNGAARPTSALALKAAEDAVKELGRLGALSWKPSYNSDMNVAVQCHSRLVTVCGGILIAGLLSGPNASKISNLTFLKYLANSSDVSVLMKLSEGGCMQKLVDFLRIHDDQEDLEIRGLQLASALMTRDNRLKQLFNRHGGWQLLLAMSTYTSGALRRQVSRTLQDVSSVANLPSNNTSSRRIHSAPPAGRRIPDIWDHIGDKWRAQDRATNVLKRPIIEACNLDRS